MSKNPTEKSTQELAIETIEEQHKVRTKNSVQTTTPKITQEPDIGGVKKETSPGKGLPDIPDNSVLSNADKEEKLSVSEQVSKPIPPPEQPRKLKKKPIAYLPLLEEELIISPRDVVIGPHYVLETLAQRMDEECKKIEPARQKKIETEYKARAQVKSYKHGLRRKLFSRRIKQGQIQTKVIDTLSCDPPSRPALKHLETGLKQKTAPTYNISRTLQTDRLKYSPKGIRIRLFHKLGRFKKDNSPQFYNTTTELDKVPPQVNEAIIIQYSKSLIKKGRVHVKNVQVNMHPRKNDIATKLMDKASDLRGSITVVPHWELYLALILIVPIGIVLM
jgi:hypothetical protein